MNLTSNDVLHLSFAINLQTVKAGRFGIPGDEPSYHMLRLTSSPSKSPGVLSKLDFRKQDLMQLMVSSLLAVSTARMLLSPIEMAKSNSVFEENL